MNYYVGIDGGGTSCRARIRNQQGEWLAKQKWQRQHHARC